MLSVLRAAVASLLLAGLAAAACTFPAYSFGIGGPPPTCFDGIFQPDREGDIDCGGICSGCVTGQSCRTATDCENRVCGENRCLPASCTDDIKNGDEADRDCGEACTTKCANGQSCKSKFDCASGVCVDGICQSDACNDGIKNGSETDVDCGGAICAKCNVGQHCNGVSDCSTPACSRGVCTPSHCADRILNEDESDVDCGGTACGPCSSVEKCRERSDCESQVCDAGVCKPSSCADGITNGTETDTDCGRDCPGGCEIGKRCELPTDCRDQICKDSVCASPSCADNAKNGAEIDIDCGGGSLSGCPGCKVGTPCTAAEDCESLVCTHNLCQPASCTDGIHNGEEGDADCGGPCPDLCKPEQRCRTGADCLTGLCTRECSTNLNVAFRSQRSSPRTDSIEIHLALENPEGDPIPLSELTARYYFTNDPKGSEELRCDWVSSEMQCLSEVNLSVGTISRPLADRYLEIGFASSAGALSPGALYQLKLRIFIPGFPMFDQTNDYSFTDRPSLERWDKVTLYRRGTLVWGKEP